MTPWSLSTSRLSRITTVDLTSRPDMPMASALCSLPGVDDVVDRLLDAEVVDRVAVVGEDDVDEVLADVVDVALDGGQHDRALATGPSTFSMCGSRWATAAFIVSADCSTKGSCIWPAPNRSPTTFMPASRMSLMMSSGLYCLHGLVEIVVEAGACRRR